MRKLMLVVGVVVASLTASGAVAQTTTTTPPYPGAPPVPTTATLDLGTKPCPSTFDITFTGFDSTLATQSEIDGVQGDDQRPTNGSVTKSVEATCPVPAPGASTLGAGRPLAATGLTPLAQTVTFGRIRVNGRLYPSKPLGSTHTITVRGTGLNGAARTVTATFRLARAGTTARSGLARTGTFALQWAPLGVGLLGIGYLLVLGTRRRRTT